MMWQRLEWKSVDEISVCELFFLFFINIKLVKNIWYKWFRQKSENRNENKKYYSNDNKKKRKTTIIMKISANIGKDGTTNNDNNSRNNKNNVKKQWQLF